MAQLSTPPVLSSAPWATTRGLLGAGVVAGPLFLGASILHGLTREGFDFTRNALSQLSLGPGGWIHIAVFIATGVLVLAGAIGLRRVLDGGPGGIWAPRLISVFGASFLLAGVFTADPGSGFPVGAPEAPAAALSTHGAIHMVSAMVGYLALCAAFLVFARRFAAQRRGGWAIASCVVPAGVLAGFAASSTTVMAFTAGAGLGLLWLTAVTARSMAGHPAAPGRTLAAAGGAASSGRAQSAGDDGG